MTENIIASTEKSQEIKKERVLKPESVCVVTSTMYPRYVAPELRTDENRDSTDNTRGDLALQTIEEVLKAGYQLVVMDEDVNESFTQELKKRGVVIRKGNRKGMSPKRQEGFQIASQLPKVKFILWTEPEKVDLIKSVPQIVKPLLYNEGDIVVPGRNEESFATYPAYQVPFEQKSNMLWNGFLRSRGLLDGDAQDLDPWFGPKAFKNNKTMLSYFLREFRFGGRDLEPALKIDSLLDTTAYSNAIFFPLISAMAEKKRVVGVTLDSYRQPASQVSNEQDSPIFERKRAVQQKQILILAKHYLDYLSKDSQRRSKSRLTV